MEHPDPFPEIPAIVDAYCSLGKWKQPVNAELYGHDPASLLEEMDQKGVAEAIVHHSLARLSHPVDGNEETLRLVEGQPRLHACWALLSRASREYASYEAYIADGVRRGVRCFAAFPRFGAYPYGYDMSLREMARAGTLAPIEERGLPLFLDFGKDPWSGTDDTDWEALRFLLDAHPDLPVILCENRSRAGNRPLASVMDDHANLHVETSGLWNYMTVEWIAQEWGAERLIFGSRSPWRSVGLALGMVTMAALPAQQRAMILAGNIRRLMEGVR